MSSLHSSTLLFSGRCVRAAALLALGVLAASVAQAQAQAPLPKSGATTARQGPIYRAVPAVAADQTQVIFFRPASSSAAGQRPGAAHVYVDGEFHAALLPNTFTRLCMAPGNHSIEAYLGDAPTYEGKSQPRTRAELEGGKTVFVAVSEQDGSGSPVPYRRADAERMLAGAHEQRHVISRASAVQPCRELAAPAPLVEKARYSLSTDALFAFGRGDAAALSPQGREALAKAAAQIRAHSTEGVSRIAVRGHADPIGSVADNQRLSEQRARTVAQLLASEGLPTERVVSEGAGSTEQAVFCPPGRSRDALIACNAPNRRVEVVVQGEK
ncbi:MAG: OmpA family protein [Pseudomonadota bacterium]